MGKMAADGQGQNTAAGRRPRQSLLRKSCSCCDVLVAVPVEMTGNAAPSPPAETGHTVSVQVLLVQTEL